MSSLKGCLVVAIIGLICLAGVSAQLSLHKLAYSENESLVKIYGENFGYDPSQVSVAIDGYDHRVHGVNDSIITCDKHADHKLYAGPMSVHVQVGGQHAKANMTLNMETVQPAEGGNILGEDHRAAIVQHKAVFLSIIPVFAGIVLVVGFFVIKKRRTMMEANKDIVSEAPAAKDAPATVEICAVVEQEPKSDQQEPKTDRSALVDSSHSVIVRDTSMEEIDLNADTTSTPKSGSGAGAGGLRDSLYSLNRSESGSDSDSSFESLSSTYSSTNCTPSSFSPDAPSSPKLDSSDSGTEGTDNTVGTRLSKRSMKREQKMTSMLADNTLPASRLGKRSMDSPYFAKHDAFESPSMTPSVSSMTPSSAGMTPSKLSLSCDSPQSQGHTPNVYDNCDALHTSQEINQRHASPFDSQAVLHSAIQRAAILRQQQKISNNNKQQSKKSPKQPLKMLLNGGRRASVSGASVNKYGGGRRSSLGTISLHATALHNSAEMHLKQQRSLRATQYIHQVDDVLVEGDE